MVIELDRLHLLIEELRQQYQREEEQAILQRDMDKAVRALCGKEACTRIENGLGLRIQMSDNLIRNLERKKRA